MANQYRPAPRKPELVPVNLIIPYSIWEKYHNICRARNNGPFHELLLALLNKAINTRIKPHGRS